MKRVVLMIVLLIAVMSGAAYGAATVFFKDGSRENGNSFWIEGKSVFLSKAREVYEFPLDEVLLEETLRINTGDRTAAGVPSDIKPAQFAASGADDLEEQFLSATGFDHRIVLFIQQFTSGVLSTVPANSLLRERFSRALSSFDAAPARKRIRADYGARLDRQTMAAVLAWEKSPLGTRIRRLETASAGMAQQPPGADPDTLPVQRRILIKELDRSAQITGMSRQLLVAALSAALGAIPTATSEQRQARAEIGNLLAGQKRENDPEMRRMVQAALVQTYRDLSDEELMEYIAFLHGEPARSFTTANMGALNELSTVLSAALVRPSGKTHKPQAKKRLHAR